MSQVFVYKLWESPKRSQGCDEVMHAFEPSISHFQLLVAFGIRICRLFRTSFWNISSELPRSLL